MILLPDQVELLDDVYSRFREGHRTVLLQSATGSGKSVMGSSLIKRSIGVGNVIWFVVPRKDLIRQMSETFREFGIKHSFIASGYDYDPVASVFIVSLQSLKSRIDKVMKPTRIVVDEVHFGGNSLDMLFDYAEIIGARVLGLSATPNRADGVGLGKWFQTMVKGKSIRWLIDNKRLSEFRAFAPDRPDLSGVGMVGGDYNQKKLASRMSEDKVLIGNCVKHYKEYASGLLGVTFAVGVGHSQMLAEAYRAQGVMAMHMDGNTPEDERRRIARAFAKREITMLCNSDLLTFGYDLASASGIKGVNIQVMMDCKPTKSQPLQLQKNGRNMRYDGDTHLFFDHGNNFAEHGLPDDEHDWSLEDKVKRKGGGSGGFVEKTRTCPVCHYSQRLTPVCTNPDGCGFVFPVESRDIDEIDGELKEIQEAQRKKEQRMEVGKARTIEDLHAIARQRGYAKGWVYKIAKVKGLR